MDKGWLQLIKSPLLKQSEQEALLTLLEKQGPDEQFLEQFKLTIGSAAKREVGRTRLAMEKFYEQTEAAEQELWEKKDKLWQTAQERLAQTAVDDIEKREEILQDYHRQVVALWQALEEKSYEMSAAILAEQIKAAD